jgi:hypothetical protein
MVDLRQPVSLTYKQLLFFCKLVSKVTPDSKKAEAASAASPLGAGGAKVHAPCET